MNSLWNSRQGRFLHDHDCERTCRRDLPPEAIRNIKRRYGRIRFLGYGLLILVLVDLISGNTSVPP